MKLSYSIRENNLGSVLPMTKTVLAPVRKENAKVVYDHKYGTDSDVTVAGVFFFVVPLLFMVFSVLKVVRYDGYGIIINSALIGGAILRVIATLWVAEKSRELNRNSIRWVIFSFILPGTALMIIGQTKKIKDTSDWKNHLYNHNRSITGAQSTIAYGNQTWQIAS